MTQTTPNINTMFIFTINQGQPLISLLECFGQKIKQ